MPMHDGSASRPRVLLVTDDDAYSADLRPHLGHVQLISLPESSVWVAMRAGLDVTRGVQAVLLDRGITGRLQLQLYELLRPVDGPALVPVIFMRSRLTAASAGFDHALDVYQPEDAALDQAGRLVQHTLALAGVVTGHDERPLPPGVAARMAAAVAGPTRGAPIALSPGTMQRIGLWAVALALIGFTFWPLLGTGPVRDAVFGPLKSFSDKRARLANSAAKVRTTR